MSNKLFKKEKKKKECQDSYKCGLWFVIHTIIKRIGFCSLGTLPDSPIEVNLSSNPPSTTYCNKIKCLIRQKGHYIVKNKMTEFIIQNTMMIKLLKQKDLRKTRQSDSCPPFKGYNN